MTDFIHAQASNPKVHAHAAHRDHVPLDLDDPHRAALEDNPSHAGRPSWRTLLAVMVRELFPPC